MINAKQVFLQLITSAFIGLGIGFLAAIIFSAIFQTPNLQPSTPAFTSQFSNSLQSVEVSAIIWASIGLVFGGTALIFEIEKWSSLKQTCVHFIVSYILFTPLAISAGWFPLNVTWLILFTVIFVFIYIICWIVSYQVDARNINQINHLISSHQRTHPREP